MRRYFSCIRVLGACVVSLLLISGCSDRQAPLFLLPHDVVTTESTARQSAHLVTHDPVVLARRVAEIGNGNQLIVWLKDESVAPRELSSFLNEGQNTPLTVGVPVPTAGQSPRDETAIPSRDERLREAFAQRLTARGATVLHEGQILPFLTLSAPGNALEPVLRELLRHPAVDYVEANEKRPGRTFRAAAGVSSSQDQIDRKFSMHRILDAWTYTRGRGVRVGVIDNGLAAVVQTGAFHDDALRMPDGSGVIPLGFVDDLGNPGSNGASIAYDDEGHGTEMVGLVGANANGRGALGVMPDGITYSLKAAFNTHVSSGHCGFWWWRGAAWCLEADDFVRAIDYACANGIKVLSLSFGGSFGFSEIYALQRAYSNCDILLVAATGNNPGDENESLARYSFVLGVGALDATGSAIGVTVNRDVAAYEGGHTTHASCSGTAYCTPNGNGRSSGTSAATATAAGIAGLLRARHPSMTASQAMDRLIRTSFGSQRQLDAEAALLNIFPVWSTVMGPTVVAPWERLTWTVYAMVVPRRIGMNGMLAAISSQRARRSPGTPETATSSWRCERSM